MALSNCKKLLFEQLKQAKIDAGQAAAERTRIAKEAKSIREEIIAPLQTDLKELQEKVILYKKGLKNKIVKANADLAEIKFRYKTN